jgi:serine/threonine protein kinase
MKCPQCQSDVPESSDHCFNCGYVLRAQPTLIRGSMLAGRFEILAPLGKGGMGMVYKAQDHKLEEIVAIKVLRPDIAANPDMERRFRKEIVLARRVRHRNVCGIHEYGDDGALRYIAMEFIEGVDLRRLLVDRGPLPPAEAFDACIHTAEGLQAIHEAGIVHRDLKTANLMRDAHGVVRLMDFGIAKQVGGEATPGGATATGLVMGTPEYMSPEQARGGKDIDHRSDIYALGVVAFELFTGSLPFRGETPLIILLKQLQEPPPLEGKAAQGLPPSVVPVLRKALAKDPDERFASAADLGAALVRARDAAGIAPLGRRSVAGTFSGPRAASFGSAATLSEASPTPATLEPLPTDAIFPPATVRPPASDQPTLEQPSTRAPRVPQALVAETVRAPDAAPIARVRPGTAVALAAVAMFAAVVGVALLRRPSPPSVEPASTVSPGPSPAAAPATATSDGTLVIDAAPWGEVVEVVDAEGRHHEPGSARYTPLALALPPGTYTVQVRHPGASKAQARTAVVRAEAVERVSVVFRRVDAEDYLRKSGF